MLNNSFDFSLLKQITIFVTQSINILVIVGLCVTSKVFKFKNSKDNIIEILKTEGKYLLKPKHNEELAQKMSNTYANEMKEFKVKGQAVNLDATDIDMLNSMIQCVDKKDVSETDTAIATYIEIVLENRDILYISSNSGEYVGTYYEDATRKKTLINLPETLVDYAQDIANSVK